jgi:hypothetical protein
VFFEDMLAHCPFCGANLFTKMANVIEIFSRLMMAVRVHFEFTFGHITDATFGAIISLCLFAVRFQDMSLQFVRIFETSLTRGTHKTWCSGGFVKHFHVTTIEAEALVIPIADRAVSRQLGNQRFDLEIIK